MLRELAREEKQRRLYGGGQQQALESHVTAASDQVPIQKCD